MSVNNLKGGMNQDVSPQQQPEGTYRYALNSVHESNDGRYMDMSNEDGNQLRFSLPDGYEARGWIYKTDGSFYVFSTDGSSSEIGIVDKYYTYTTLINDPCLNFVKRVDGVYRLRRGCEDVIYFTDGENPVRTINMSDIERYSPDGIFDCSLIKLSRDFDFPLLSTEVVDSGGTLRLGTYRVIIQYLDDYLNETNFIVEAPPVRIYDENTTDVYDSIDGGFNLDTDPTNGVPTSTKSIRVNVEDLDLRFPYYRIGIAITDSGDGTTNNFVISPEISTEQTSFLINGDFTDYLPASLEQFLIGSLRVNKAEHIEQIDNRLILANTQGEDVNLCSLQKYASKMRTKYVVRSFDKNFAVGGDSKNPNSNFISFMGDEVYALGVVFTKPGYESPVYHIPGRPADVNPFSNCEDIIPQDTGVISSWVPEISYLYSESEYNDLAEKLPRWKVYNTAYQLFPNQGLMGYHESEQTYPDEKDCNGESIWGVDSCGNELAGTPIRHHRMPNRLLVPLVENYLFQTTGTAGIINTIGVEVDNIEIPPGFTGYYFVRGKRDANNSTIWDKGILVHRGVSSENIVDPYPRGDRSIHDPLSDSQYKMAITPKSAFNTQYPESDFLSIEAQLTPVLPLTTSKIADADLDNSVSNDIEVKVDMYFYGAAQIPQVRGVKFEKAVFVERLKNTSFSDPNPFPIEITDNLDALVTSEEVLQDKLLVQTDYIFDSAPYVTEKSVDYFSFKVNRDVFNNLYAIEYVPIGGILENQGFRGDTFVSHMGYPLSNRLQENDVTDPGKMIPGDYISFWVETELNTGLRSGGNSTCDAYLQVSDATNTSKHELNIYYRTKRYDNDNAEDIDCGDYYALNPDFNILDTLQTKLSRPRTYDCCSECLELFKTRILYSEQSFQEEITDNYRSFLANNYRDIPGHSGEITNIFKYNDNLYVHTVEALWQQPRTYQERVTDDGTLSFLGTGSFFEMPPRVVIDTTGGSAGCVDKWSMVKSKHGIVWVDSIGMDVYQLSNGLKAVSDNGMRTFFQNNLTSHLKNFFDQVGEEYIPPYADIISTYDPRYERYIITKLDYKPLRRVEIVEGSPNEFRANVLYYSKVRRTWFYYENNTLITVQLGDPRFFENKSWTVSLHPSGRWLSFHSYLPLMYAFNKHTFVSFVNEGAWSHDDNDNTQSFYDDDYRFIIEPVFNQDPLKTKVTDSLIIQCESRTSELNRRNEFFDSVVLYNSRQCSGEVPLVVKQKGVDYLRRQAANIGIPVKRRENDYMLNHFRDMVVDYDEYFFTKDWEETQDTYPIDKVINNNVFGVKSYTRKERFRDKFLIARLIKEGGDNIKMTTRFVINRER